MEATPELNLRQLRALATWADAPGFTRAEYQAAHQIGARTAKRDLRELAAAGRIRLVGRSTASFYQVAR